MTEHTKKATLSEYAAAIQAALTDAEDNGAMVYIENKCAGCCSDFEIYVTDGNEAVDLVIL